MGICYSNIDKEIYKQEKFVRKNLNSFQHNLKKYPSIQVESKLRQLYHKTDYLKPNTFISNNDWFYAKNRSK